MIRTIIVDDEPLARKRVKALLKRHTDVEVVAECATGRDAVSVITRDRPDVVFLDIQMPRMDGFAVIEEVGVEKMPMVIFVTAYEEHAVRAFEVNALDYLLKPFDEKRFATAIKRVRNELELGDRSAFRQRVLGAIADIKGGHRYRARFAVKTASRIYFVPTDEIDWIDATGKYVRLRAGAKEHVVRMAIGQVETELDPQYFVRIHRSTIINIRRIRELQPLFHGEYVVIMQDGAELTLSRGYRHRLRALLGLPEDAR